MTHMINNIHVFNVKFLDKSEKRPHKNVRYK